MTSFLLFRPIYQERVWGGRTLTQALGRDLPVGKVIGESWEMVDRPEAQSVVAGGPQAGRTLREVIAADPAGLLGPGWPADRAFPILVKWLDCRERLSLQVHPPAAVAASLGGEPKTENWYVAHADPGAAVLAGLKPGVGAEEFERALGAATADQCVERMPTRAGDSLLVHSGVMHAIDGGNLILEIQQNSDTTYRVYDWGRVGLDGQPRALHVRESMVSLRANTAPAPKLVRADGPVAVLADCAEFRITQHTLRAGERLGFAPRGEARIVSAVTGPLAAADGEIPRGANALVPYAADFTATSPAGGIVLVTDRFSRR